MFVPIELEDDDLTLDHLPSPDAGWEEIDRFAVTFDGWGIPDVGAFANHTHCCFQVFDELPPLTLRALRACLWFEDRRHCHYGEAPSAEMMPYIRALVQEITDAVLVGGRDS